jgi:hypothetical protein
VADAGKFLLLTLVIYRLTRLVTLDEGPFGVFLKLRAGLGAYDLGANGQAKTNLGRGISCPHCAGIWLALIVTLVAYGWQVETMVYWLALAGAQSFLQSLER